MIEVNFETTQFGKRIVVREPNIGSCSIAITKGMPYVGYLLDVSVEESERGNGYGTKLVERAKKEAKMDGEEQLLLWCKPEMVEWLSRRGFTEIMRETTSENVGMSLDL